MDLWKVIQSPHPLDKQGKERETYIRGTQQQMSLYVLSRISTGDIKQVERVEIVDVRGLVTRFKPAIA
jgi:hypothetical protein